MHFSVVLLLFCYPIFSSSAECLYDGVYCSEDCQFIIKCVAGHEFIFNECNLSYDSFCNIPSKDCAYDGKKGTCIPTSFLGKNWDNSTMICRHDKPMPHPMDCTKYFWCPEKQVRSCERGKSFNPETLACDSTLGSSSCQKGLGMEECNTENVGRMMALEENPNIIQICTYKKVCLFLIRIIFIMNKLNITLVYGSYRYT